MAKQESIAFALYMIYIIWLLVVTWKVFVKTGRHGIFSIIPIVSAWQWFKMAGLPGILCLIPFFNIFLYMWASARIARRFGMSTFMVFLAVVFPVVPLSCIAFNKYLEYDF